MRSLALCILSLLSVRGDAVGPGVLPKPNFLEPRMAMKNHFPSPYPVAGQISSPDRVAVNPLNPSATSEGRIFKLLDVVMTPITTYFDKNNPKFSTWNRDVALIMDEGSKKDIVGDLYRMQLSLADPELKNFWGEIMGELLKDSISRISADASTLEVTLNAEKGKGAQTYEFKDLQNKSLDDYTEFLGTCKFILNNLGLGITNHNTKAYNDVIRPFLDAAVAFKALSHRVLARL